MLDSGWYILGSEVEVFEKEFVFYIGVSYVVGVVNGIDVLEVVFCICGIGLGDLVIIVFYMVVVIIVVIELVGVIFVLVDIDFIIFMMDVSCLEEIIIEILNVIFLLGWLKVIIFVYLYGYLVDMLVIMVFVDCY